MWSAWPQAQEVIDAAIAELAARSPWLVRFERKLLEQTGECLLRRIDHLALPRETYAARLGEVGYTVEKGLGETEATAWHPQAYLPRVWLCEGEPWRCALSVESVEALSLMTSSRSLKVCDKFDSIARRRYFSPL